MDYTEILEAEEKKHSKAPLIVALSLLAVLAAGYLGLCAFAGGLDAFYPNQTINGVDVGGLTAEQAEARLKAEVPRQKLDVFLFFPEQEAPAAPETEAAPDATVSYQELGVTAETDFAASVFLDGQQSRGFFQKGWFYAASLLHLRSGGFITPTPDEALFSAAADDLTRTLSPAPIDGGYSIGENALEITVAKDGRSVSPAALKQSLRDTLYKSVASNGGHSASCSAEVLPAKALTAQEIFDEIAGEMKNAGYDPETKTITPERLGADFDVARAQQLMDAADPGETVSVDAEIQLPTVTAEELKAVLFRDVLGSATTHVGGTAARKSNVKLASAAVNGTVLNAGETFSYNETTGQRTLSKGYQAAPAYVRGETVDEVGGGVCQPSSTLYLATLNSNLEIAERYAHRYIPSYIKPGMDATVSWGGPDYKFTNNTDYPIKIQAVYAKGYLTMSIFGTRTDEITVKMTNEHLSTTAFETVYEDDPTLPAGTETVKTTPYTGYKYKTYRNLYGGDGKLISSTYEATSDYKSRNKIIQKGPAPAAPESPVVPVDPAAPVISPLPPITGPTAPETEVPIGGGAVPDSPESPDVPIGGGAVPDSPQSPDVPIGGGAVPDSPQSPDVPIGQGVTPDP